MELRPDALRAAALLESAAASSGEAAYLAMLLQAREGRLAKKGMFQGVEVHDINAVSGVYELIWGGGV